MSKVCPPAAKQPTIVYLHGLGRGPRCFEKMKRYVKERTGLDGLALQYASWSRSKSLKDVASDVASEIRTAVGDGGKVFLVTHSMGGVVARCMQDLPERGQVEWCGSVLMAPPNSGSSLARTVTAAVGPLFKIVWGRCASELLGNGEDWPPPPRPCGVIVGTKPISINPISWVMTGLSYSGAIQGPHDGTVTVAETKLPEDQMDDYIEFHGSHSWLMQYQEACVLVADFINTGRFNK
ncbi:hypothetical protein BSKO_11153 [Bryopsis sp. KO-2023]|nr:hypothetical protein BSKO_11153 [Bryopsis sp. KO-2023]